MLPRNSFLPGAGGPNYYQYGPAAGAAKSGLDFGTILNNTQKTLNLVNSALPLIYQVGPLFRNASTMLKIYGEMKKDDRDTKPTTNSNIASSINQATEVPSDTYNQRNQTNFQPQMSGSRYSNTNNNYQQNHSNTTNNPRFFI